MLSGPHFVSPGHLLWARALVLWPPCSLSRHPCLRNILNAFYTNSKTFKMGLISVSAFKNTLMTSSIAKTNVVYQLNNIAVVDLLQHVGPKKISSSETSNICFVFCIFILLSRVEGQVVRLFWMIRLQRLRQGSTCCVKSCPDNLLLASVPETKDKHRAAFYPRTSQLDEGVLNWTRDLGLRNNGAFNHWYPNKLRTGQNYEVSNHLH